MNTKKQKYTLLLLFISLIGFSACTATKDTAATKDETEVSKENTEDVAFFSDENGCPDLVVEKLKVVEEKRSKIYVSYTITNKGNSTVNIMGKSEKEKTDNLAVKMYFSSDESYQRGDILIGGDYVDNSFLITNEGKLKPGESYTATVKISNKTQTSYTPYIVFDVDAWQIITECNETNNQAALLVK